MFRRACMEPADRSTNNVEEFKALTEAHKGEIAAVIMEPIRNDFPEKEFMETIIDYCHSKGVVLLFDEVTAGFRLCAGGSHLYLGYEPDMAVFAKGLTNGYPLSAIIGRKEIMEAAQGTFISSTFFTERIGLAAALKSIEVYEKKRVWEKQSEYGKKVKQGWQNIADKYGIFISVGGIDPLAHFGFNYENAMALKTYFTQEMLKKGYLATTAFYASFAHSNNIIERYLSAADEVFKNISEIIKNNTSEKEFLQGEVCHTGFQRLI